MNRIPISEQDSFEQRLLAAVYYGIAIIFAGYGLSSLDQLFVEKGLSCVSAISVMAVLVVNLIAIAVRGLDRGKWIDGNAAGNILIAFNFGVNLFPLFSTAQTESALPLRFLLYPFIIVSAGFFSRKKWIPPALALTVLAIFFCKYFIFPYYVFAADNAVSGWNSPTVRETAKILVIGLVASILLSVMYRRLYEYRRKKQDYIKKISHFDQETGLPNIRELSGEIANRIGKIAGTDTVLVLAGIRLLKLDEMSEKLGYENMINWILRFSGEFSASIDLWIRGINDKANDQSVQLYRLESSLLIFPIIVPANIYRSGPILSEIWTKMLIDVLQAEHIESLVDFYGAFTVAPDDGETSAELLNNLLNVLHRSTPDQKTRFIPFNASAFDQYLRKERLKEQMLSDSFENEIYAVFQPKVSTKDETCEEFEALARWKNPILGLISPGEFIPLAEQANTMGILTKKILKDTRAFIGACAEAGLERVKIAFNLSPTLISRDYLISLAGWIADNKLGKSLEIEITEGILLNTTKETEEDFAMIKELGVSFAIDDFGTGYSNLSYLQRFNAEVIKIDKSFIDGLPGSEKSAHLVRAMILMAQAFDTKVVAEGVENEQQMLSLRDTGCDLIQGYYYSRPLESAPALEWLKNRAHRQA
jgi:EAL domain-containing protein (putative c-di-GMP-specific phosphodiesterase class I)